MARADDIWSVTIVLFRSNYLIYSGIYTRCSIIYSEHALIKVLGELAKGLGRMSSIHDASSRH